MAARRKQSKSNSGRKKVLGGLLIVLALLLMVSLATHIPVDDHLIETSDNPFAVDFANQVGIVGALSAYILMFFLGWLSFFIPILLIKFATPLFGWEWGRLNPALWTSLVIGLFLTIMVNVYRIVEANHTLNYTAAAGGYFVFYLGRFFIKIAGETGSYIILLAGILAGLTYLAWTYEFIAGFFAFIGNIGRRLAEWVHHRVEKASQRKASRKEKRVKEEEALDEVENFEENASVPEIPEDIRDEVNATGEHRKVIVKKKPSPTISLGVATADYHFPTLDLLNENPQDEITVSPEELAATAKALKDTLETFDIAIEGQIEKYPGPVITRFEFKPAAGVKINRIVALADDLALALKAKRIRIVAPIPGKAAVGVEIPNRQAHLVCLKDILSSEIFGNPQTRLPLALGKTISGKPYVTDLSRMPHLLIAGATGSGKSVCINAVITSLLYRLHPRELKFIFIDPKMLELSVYAGIPHLGRPVVTNSKRAEKVLSDAVVEMELRYKKLAGVGVRNIQDYNTKQKSEEEKMPYIVIIVDELADMMMAAASGRTEMLITRLAQMARAVGIHLILATQRPSVDVITGLIKANFSARIAFQVASKVDSRTILDANGAEKLLGQGDMLFLPPGQPEPIRLHGAFISGEETERLVKFILDQFPKIEKAGEEKAAEAEDGGEDDVDLDDPLFLEAAQTVVRHKQGSVSLLQRKLGIGYQRAARLIDRLEEAKIVSSYDGSKAREVLVDKNYIDQLTASRSMGERNPEQA